MRNSSLKLLLVLVLVISIVAAGCAQTDTPGPSTDAPPVTPVETDDEPDDVVVNDYTIGVFVKDSTTPFWRYIMQGAYAEAEELGVTIVEYAPMKNTDTAAQINQIEDAIQSGVDAICIAAIDGEAVKPALQRAIDANIPVIIFNSRVDLEGAKTFVGVDNYDGSLKMTERVFADMGYKGNIVILESDPAAWVNQQRVQAVLDLVDKYPDIEVLDKQPAYARREQAMTVMENILQSHSSIDMVWGLNDATALGAIQAIEDAARAGILVSGFDGTPEGIEAVIDGRLAYTLDQSPFQQGAFSVRAAVDVLNGKTIEKEITTGGTVIDKSNAQAILDEFYGD
ncbi:MAG: sugar ABC transporter substrate-binding protein [Christensenellales bacterium]